MKRKLHDTFRVLRHYAYSRILCTQFDMKIDNKCVNEYDVDKLIEIRVDLEAIVQK